MRPLIGQPLGTGVGTETADAAGLRLLGRRRCTCARGRCTTPRRSPGPSATIRNGGTIVVMERFDAAAALSLIERYRVTEGQFVPTMFVRMLRLPAASAKGTTCPACGSRSMPPRRRGRGQARDDRLARADPRGVLRGQRGQRYLVIDSADWLAHPGSVGRPLGVELHICGEDGAELPAGEIGTVWFERRQPLRVPQRPGQDRLGVQRRRAGAPSATWATWTTKATSTSRTGAPT